MKLKEITKFITDSQWVSNTGPRYAVINTSTNEIIATTYWLGDANSILSGYNNSLVANKHKIMEIVE